MPATHLIPVLTGLGIEEARATELVADLPAEKAGEFKPDELLTGIRTGFETKLRNDPNFIGTINEDVLPPTLLKSIESKQYGRAANITRQNILKGFGMTEEDFKDLGDEGKKIEVFARAAAERYAAGKTSDKQLQADLLAARKALETLQAEEPQKLQTLEAKYQTEMNDKLFNFIVLAQVAGAKGLKVPAGYVSDKIVQKLKTEYAFEIDGTDAKVKQKNNPKLDALDGTEVLTLSKAIQKILQADNLIAEEKPGGDGKKDEGVIKLDINGSGGEGLKISSHITDRIQKNIAAEKAVSQ